VAIDGSSVLTVIIGNDPSLTKGTPKTAFKEVRVWFSKQSAEDVLRFLYQKVDPVFYADLLYYFQLAAGSKIIKNFNEFDIVTEVEVRANQSTSNATNFTINDTTTTFVVVSNHN